MGKYIIELEEAPFIQHFDNGIGESLYRVKGFNSLVFDWNGLQMLTPYTEPDMEQIRKEAYEQGLSDAWEAARKIVTTKGIPADDMAMVFDDEVNYDYIFSHYSASEAIEKIRAYEQEKEEQIQVGDEIETPSGLKGYVVNFTDDELVHYVSSEGRFGTIGMSAVLKTGRHFPEIAEVLQKMKES